MRKLIFFYIAYIIIPTYAYSKMTISIAPDWLPVYKYEKPLVIQLYSIKHVLLTSQQQMNELQDKIKKLQAEFFEKEIKFIKLRIQTFEQKLYDLKKKDQKLFNQWIQDHITNLFIDERQALSNIIDSDEKYAEDAQKVLDQILKLITTLNTELLNSSISDYE